MSESRRFSNGDEVIPIDYSKTFDIQVKEGTVFTVVDNHGLEDDILISAPREQWIIGGWNNGERVTEPGKLYWWINEKYFKEANPIKVGGE